MMLQPLVEVGPQPGSVRDRMIVARSEDRTPETSARRIRTSKKISSDLAVVEGGVSSTLHAIRGRSACCRSIYKACEERVRTRRRRHASRRANARISSDHEFQKWKSEALESKVENVEREQGRERGGVSSCQMVCRACRVVRNGARA